MLEIFFPIRNNNNIYIKKNVLIIYLNGLNISFVLVQTDGKKRIIKNVINDKIVLEDLHEDTLEEILAKKISDNISNFKYDHARVVLTGNNSILKTLSFPFSNIEKIKMIAPFELEYKLPFSLSECSIDSICSKKDENNLYQVISALVKQETINKIEEINNFSNLKMNSLSIDIIELMIHHNQKDWDYFHSLVIFTENSINCIFYKNNIIITIRTFDINDKLNNFSVEKKQEKELNEEIESKNNSNKDEKKESSFELIQLNEELPILKNEEVQIKVDNEININSEIKKDLNKKDDFKNKKNENLIENITSAFNVFFKQNEIEKKNFKIYLVGVEIKNYIFEQVGLNLEVSVLDYDIYLDKEVSLVFENENFKKNFNKKNEILVICSFLYKDSLNFNLAHEEESKYKKDLIKKSLIFGIFLIFILFSLLITFNILRLNKLKKKIKYGEIEAINFLKKEFDLQSNQTTSLEKSIKEAENNVIYLENNLPFLVSEEKYSFLKIFEKISLNLSKEIKNLEIKEFRWKKKENENDILSIQGSVGDWDSLYLLEECLKKTEIFSEIPQAQDLNFFYNLIIINKV